MDEVSCYEFTEKLLDELEKLNVQEIITIGGIGLKKLPESPKIYCTDTSQKYIKKYIKDKNINEEIHGVVGPIVGVTGTLVGLAGKRGINSVTLLSETYAHPLFLGLNGAKKVLNILKDIHGIKLDLKNLEEDIKEIEGNLNVNDKIEEISKKANFLKKMSKYKDTSYIG